MPALSTLPAEILRGYADRVEHHEPGLATRLRQEAAAALRPATRLPELAEEDWRWEDTLSPAEAAGLELVRARTVYALRGLVEEDTARLAAEEVLWQIGHLVRHQDRLTLPGLMTLVRTPAGLVGEPLPEREG